MTHEPEREADYLPLILGGAMFMLLLIISIFSLQQTHLAPDCPGPRLECVQQVNSNLYREATRRAAQ